MSGHAGGCSDLEYRTHFALWCVFITLMIGCGRLCPRNTQTSSEPDLIAINQDEEARPPMFSSETPNRSRWYVPSLSNGEYALLLSTTMTAGRHGCQLYDLVLLLIPATVLS